MPVKQVRSAGTTSTAGTDSASATSTTQDISSQLGNAEVNRLLAAGVGTSLLAFVTSGGILERGSQGPEVEELQELLGFRNPDGVYGEITARAVILLQGAKGLLQSGDVNIETLSELASVAAGEETNDVLFQHQTRGASAATASQSGISGGGDASVAMAWEDEERVLQYQSLFEKAGDKYDLPPAVLAAIASRETRGGNVLGADGFSSADGQGFGLMQVDKRFHDIEGGPRSGEHVEQAASILRSMLDSVVASHPDWSASEQLRGALAAYNSGAGSVRSVSGMDRGTTGGDYSGDTWIRAQYYARFFRDQSLV